MSWVIFVIVGAAVSLTPLIQIIWKHGSFERWVAETPLPQIFTTQAMIMFGGALILFGLVFSK